MIFFKIASDLIHAAFNLMDAEIDFQLDQPVSVIIGTNFSVEYGSMLQNIQYAGFPEVEHLFLFLFSCIRVRRSSSCIEIQSEAYQPGYFLDKANKSVLLRSSSIECYVDPQSSSFLSVEWFGVTKCLVDQSARTIRYCLITQSNRDFQIDVYKEAGNFRNF